MGSIVADRLIATEPHDAHLHHEFSLAMQHERGLLGRRLDAHHFDARLLHG